MRLRLLPAAEQGAGAEGDLRALGRRPSHLDVRGGVLRAARGGTAGDQRGEPRSERADPAVGRGAGRPSRPARRARPDEVPARRGARAGRLRLLDGARVRCRARSRRGRARVDVRGLRQPPRRLRDAHTPPGRGRRRGGSRGAPDRGARGRAAAGLTPRPAERHRLLAPLHRARRGLGRGRDGRRVRHAHAPLRDDVPAHCAARHGRSRIRPVSRRSSAATSSGGSSGASRASSARAATGAGSSCSTTTPGRDTPGATSRRSQPSAARIPSTPSTTCCSERPLRPGS